MKYILFYKIVDSCPNYQIVSERGTAGRSATSIPLAIERYCEGGVSLLNSNRLDIYDSLESALMSKIPKADIIATFTSVPELQKSHPELFL